MPFPTHTCSAVSIDHKIYVIGGINSNKTQVYDTDYKTWQELSNLPSDMDGENISCAAIPDTVEYCAKDLSIWTNNSKKIHWKLVLFYSHIISLC